MISKAISEGLCTNSRRTPALSDIFTDTSSITGLYGVINAIVLIKLVHKLTEIGPADEVFNFGPPCMHNVMDTSAMR